jgi:hypothetical protein
VVEDLRIVIDSERGRPELRWVTTRDRLRPEPTTGSPLRHRFQFPVVLPRRSLPSLSPPPALNWSASPDVKHRLQLRAQIHPKREWVELVAFDFWPPPEDSRGQYLAHRNEPSSTQ